MPKIIKKYKLEPAFDNESEFEVTRVKQVETKTTMRTDDEGYPISDRESPRVEQEVKHGITAISLPSRSPAKVIPIEVAEVSTAESLAIEGAINQTQHQQKVPETTGEDRPRPIKSSHLMDNALGPEGRPAAINLTKAMEGARSNNVPIPKTGEITWADGSDAQGDGDMPQSF